MSYKSRSNSSKRIEARIRYNDATETAIIPVSWQQFRDLDEEVQQAT